MQSCYALFSQLAKLFDNDPKTNPNWFTVGKETGEILRDVLIFSAPDITAIFADAKALVKNILSDIQSGLWSKLGSAWTKWRCD